MLSAALSGVWPPSRDMQRRLVARQFVPTAEPGEEAAAGEASQADGTAGGSSASGATTSSSNTGGATEGATEGKAAARAAALAAALQAHCPGISAADMQKSALELRLFLGCRAVGEQSGDGPSLQVRTDWGREAGRGCLLDGSSVLGVRCCHPAHAL